MGNFDEQHWGTSTSGISRGGVHDGAVLDRSEVKRPRGAVDAQHGARDAPIRHPSQATWCSYARKLGPVVVVPVPDAVERFRVLSDKLDEVSPHYRLDMARNPDGVTVTGTARYPGAELDAPITVETQLAFDDTPAGEEARAAFAALLDYGGEFQASGDQILRFAVGAPAGLGGDFAGGAVRMTSLPWTPTSRSRHASRLNT